MGSLFEPNWFNLCFVIDDQDAVRTGKDLWEIHNWHAR